MYVTMWVVRAGDDVYVRSAYGPDNPWYRRATASGAGRIRAGAWNATSPSPTPLHATPRHATPEACAGVDAAYHAKYDRYGPTIVGSAEWRGL